MKWIWLSTVIVLALTAAATRDEETGIAIVTTGLAVLLAFSVIVLALQTLLT